MLEAIKVLDVVSKKFEHSCSISEGLIGGAAYDVYGVHFPEETRDACENSDAILFGSVGGLVSELQLPKWQDFAKKSILALRKEFGFNANFRPVKVFPRVS